MTFKVNQNFRQYITGLLIIAVEEKRADILTHLFDAGYLDRDMNRGILNDRCGMYRAMASLTDDEVKRLEVDLDDLWEQEAWAIK